MNIKIILQKYKLIMLAPLLVAGSLSFTNLVSGSEVTAQSDKPKQSFYGAEEGKGDKCGSGENAYKTKINFGCLGDSGPSGMGPIEDMLYAIVRFISFGVGLVVVGSIIVAGIQYSTSEGNPETTQAAKNRVRDAVIGLIIYLFAFALVQYLVPGGLFK